MPPIGPSVTLTAFADRDHVRKVVSRLDGPDTLDKLVEVLRRAGRVRTPKDAADYTPPSFFRDLIFDPTMGCGSADLILLSSDWFDRFRRWNADDRRIALIPTGTPGIYVSTLTDRATIAFDGRLPMGTAISLTSEHIKLTSNGLEFFVLAAPTHAMIEGVADGSI